METSLTLVENAWAMCMATREDGLCRMPATNKEEESVKDTFPAPSSKKTTTRDNAMKQVGDVAENCNRNMSVHDGQDLRKVAEDMMKLATNCLKECMARY
jgi:hypothetical protein